MIQSAKKRSTSTLQQPAEARFTMCQRCHTRDCCTFFFVQVTCRDIVRISTTLQVPPEQFCACVASPSADPQQSFALTGSVQRHLVTLKRRAQGQARRPCLFLLELNSGRRLCGIGELAPSSCQLFPLSLSDTESGYSLYEGPACPERFDGQVPLSDRECEQLRIRREDLLEHHRIIRSWNDKVAELEGKVDLVFGHFLRYVMNQTSR